MTTVQIIACPECGIDQTINKDGRIRSHKKGAERTTCPGSGRPTGETRIPKPWGGWYTDPETKQKLRRVSSILDCSPKGEALIYWAGNTVADCAMEYLPKLVRALLDPAERVKERNWLARAHTRKKDERAHIGTAVHLAIECHILDLPVPAPIDLVPREVKDETLRQQMATDIAACLPHFHQFVKDFGVTFTASEMVIANYTHRFAGTLDWMAHIRGYGHRMGDTKTGGGLDEKLKDGSPKGVYPEAGIQISGYRHGEIGWLKDGTKVPLPATEPEGVVLHLRPEGYRLYPARAGEEEFAYFLALIQVDRFLTEQLKTVIGQPLVPHRHDLDEAGACRTPGCVDNPIGNPFRTEPPARHLQAVPATQDWS